MAPMLCEVHNQMPHTKWVISICSCFDACHDYHQCWGFNPFEPVDIYGRSYFSRRTDSTRASINPSKKALSLCGYSVLQAEFQLIICEDVLATRPVLIGTSWVDLSLVLVCYLWRSDQSSNMQHAITKRDRVWFVILPLSKSRNKNDIQLITKVVVRTSSQFIAPWMALLSGFLL